ncbi:hypothetical protein [Streptomyces kebangsaanensis]|nr:hypothetical protein [Streptomyces kebangsaanensis]
MAGVLADASGLNATVVAATALTAGSGLLAARRIIDSAHGRGSRRVDR